MYLGRAELQGPRHLPRAAPATRGDIGRANPNRHGDFGRSRLGSVFTDGILEGNGSGKVRGLESRVPGGKGGKSKGGRSFPGAIPESGRGGGNNLPVNHNSWVLAWLPKSRKYGQADRDGY